jgi:hypothetical protein
MTNKYVAELENAHPQIRWREPVQISVGGMKTLCCRVCIALEGIAGADVEEKGFDSYEDFEEHWRAFHPE